jgi:hypothetical protein
MSRPNTYNVTIINELHEAWAMENGYRPQAASVKPQAPSVKPKRSDRKIPEPRSTNQQ